MKKLNTKLIAVWVLLMSFMTVNAADILLRLNPKPSSSITSYTFSTGDIFYALDAATMSGSTSNTVFPAPDNARVQLKECVISLVSTSASAITVWGSSSGSTSARTIFQVSVADTKDGTYTLLEDVTTSTNIISNINGNTGANGMNMSKVTGLSIAKGKFVKITFTTSTSGGSTQNVNISGFDITPMAPAAPSIVKFVAQGVEATIDESAKTITAELTYGSNLSAITPIVTIGGTATDYSPKTAQNFSAPVVYTATDGVNNVNYSVTLTVPSAPPAPVITLSSGSTNQALKVGATIESIVYNISNATGATVSGLPTNLSGLYASTGTNTGTYTIAGTVGASVNPGKFDYTVTATSISGYGGAVITSAGSINVKSTTAKKVLYITATGTVSATDTKLYPLINENPNYLVTLKAAEATAPASSVYDAYDLIVLNETVASANLEAGALKSVDKPILNLKSYVYSADPKWGWGTPDNGSATNLAISVMQPSHPIFAGITINTGSMDLLSAVSGGKGIQPADVTLAGSINVAIAPKAVSGNAIAIHDVPAAVRGVVNSKYLMIPVSDLSYGNFTNDAMTLFSNAIDYLLNGTQFVAPSLQISSFNVSSVAATIDQTAKTIYAKLPIGTGLSALQPTITLAGVGTSVSPASTLSTDFSNSATTPVNYTVTDGINYNIYAVTVEEGTTGNMVQKMTGINFDGRIIYNAEQSDLQVYNAVGRKIISSNQNIDMSTYVNGIYILKSNDKIMKLMLSK